ncbi:uncharacterized protein BKCO1_1000629 [Diplodia corticola]|uniref:4a-hydroxytetrahydrobiopterin dehydratase n=1 Tax=Diplodia corticola TaxID=236234 RepID=A0A1J9RKY1_9PEZI|nr:uncharacterized protein BKCO1_1000629 [Diplodia corticola]OJD40626.1 hypothetical protein BKCO1_1000629 [Diplodia corticola]
MSSTALRMPPRLRTSPTAVIRAHRLHHHHHHRAITLAALPRHHHHQPPSRPHPPAPAPAPSRRRSSTSTLVALSSAPSAPLITLVSLDPTTHKASALLARLHALLATTPWRLTKAMGEHGASDALERTYVFATPQRAAAFSWRVAHEVAAARAHDPDWSGCGRRVYVRWTTHGPPGLSPADLDCAEATEAAFVEVAAAGGEEEEVRPLEGGDGEGEEEEERTVEGGGVMVKRRAAPGKGTFGLWFPEWRRVAARGDRDVKEWANEERLRLYEWWRAKALVEGEGEGSEGGQAWPAWSMVFGRACVTQTRFEEDGRGRIAIAKGSKWKWTDAELEAARKIKKETALKPPTGKTTNYHALVLRKLLEKAVMG